MAVLNAPRLKELAPDVMVSECNHGLRGAVGRVAGLTVDRVEPAPAVLAVEGTAAGQQRPLALGGGLLGRVRDSVMRALTVAAGRCRQRAAARVGIGLRPHGVEPLRRLIATLPALEAPRPDWPSEAAGVRPLHFEPTEPCCRSCPVTARWSWLRRRRRDWDP
jgi:hypothetical protein